MVKVHVRGRARYPGLCSLSSVGQNACFTYKRSLVRVQQRAPWFIPNQRIRHTVSVMTVWAASDNGNTLGLHPCNLGSNPRLSTEVWQYFRAAYPQKTVMHARFV